MTSGGKLTEGLFKGETINTPSMLCVSDYLDALAWVERIGGVKATMARSEANLKVIADFVAANDWISFLAKDPATRSNTSVCLTLKLAGIRIWCGATVESSDLQALMPWLTWAYQSVSA